VADKRLKELIKNISTRIYQMESGVKTYRDVDEFPPLMVAEDSESDD
jgi:hypothetical protein